MLAKINKYINEGPPDGVTHTRSPTSYRTTLRLDSPLICLCFYHHLAFDLELKAALIPPKSFFLTLPSWLLQSRLISTPAHALWYRYCFAPCHMFLSQKWNVLRSQHTTIFHSLLFPPFIAGVQKYTDDAAFSMCSSIDVWTIGLQNKRADCMNIHGWFNQNERTYYLCIFFC